MPWLSQSISQTGSVLLLPDAPNGEQVAYIAIEVGAQLLDDVRIKAADVPIQPVVNGLFGNIRLSGDGRHIENPVFLDLLLADQSRQKADHWHTPYSLSFIVFRFDIVSTLFDFG